MKHFTSLLLLILLSVTSVINHTRPDKSKEDVHTTQKKQFVNFINDDGEYARNLVDLTSNEADGFDDLFRGRGGSMGGGGMQLSENSLGGLAVDGDNMEGAYNQMGVGGNSFSNTFDENSEQRTVVSVYPAMRRRHHLRRWFICRTNNVLPWVKLRLKCASSPMGQPISSPDVYGNDGGFPYNNAPASSSFFGSFDVNAPGGGGDMLSPFYNSENKLEDNINLGDSMGANNQGVDVNSFNNVLQSLNHMENTDPNSLGLGGPGKSKATANSDVLSNELGDLDSSDDKLQKLLESSIGDDGNSASATVGSFLSALLSQQGNGFHTQHIGQQQQPSMQEGNNYGQMNPQQMQQQNALNQLSGTLTPNDMPMQTPVTVHVHASDKPAHKQGPIGNIPEESRAVAQQAQDTAMRQHKLKLSRLKKRLALLRQKLTELEDEQSKKSMKASNDPQETRKDAIKRILIKNLKIAAMIASKEVQLEESKSHELESMSRRKDDESMSDSRKTNQQKFSFSKPVTELSKKAEDEVNHLTDTTRTKINSTFHQKSRLVQQMRRNTSSSDQQVDTPVVPITNMTAAQHNVTKTSLTDLTKNSTLANKSSLMKINETLQNLDGAKSPETSNQVFLKKLRTQITSMSLDKDKGG